MNETEFEHYLDEIVDSIGYDDPIKIMLLMKHFKEISDNQRERALLYLEEYVAPELLLQAISPIVLSGVFLKSNNIRLKNFIEPLLIKYPKFLEKYLSSVDTIEHKEIFIYLVSIASELDNQSLCEVLEKHLTAIKDEEIIILILSTLGKMGASDLIPSITEYIYTENRSFQIEAIKALGNIATKRALNTLFEALGRDVSLDMFIINTISKISNDDAYYALLSSLSLKNARIRSFITTKLINLGNKTVNSLLLILKESITDDHLIAILLVVEYLKDQQLAKAVRKIIHNHHKNPNVRVSAYQTLAKIDYPRSGFTILAGLEDPVDDVSFAVATAVNDNYSKSMIEGIKRFVNSKVIPKEHLIEIFIFSNCDNIIESIRYDISVEECIASICSRENMEEYAKKYGFKSKFMNKSKRAPLIWAVDDSKIIVKMYERFGKQSEYRVKTFDLATDAVRAIKSGEELPKFIFTDLNMPNLTGIGFAKILKESNKTNLIPTVLVTTQSDAAKDNEIGDKLFNEILYKPFSNDDLANIADQILQEN